VHYSGGIRHGAAMRQLVFLIVTLLFVVKVATYTAFSAMANSHDDDSGYLQTEDLDGAPDRIRADPTENTDPGSRSRSVTRKDEMPTPFESAVLRSRSRRSVIQGHLEWPLVKRRGWGKRNLGVVIDGDELDLGQDEMTPELNHFLSGVHLDKRRGWGKRTQSRNWSNWLVFVDNRYRPMRQRSEHIILHFMSLFSPEQVLAFQD